MARYLTAYNGYKILGGLLIFIGIAFYLFWGINYHDWGDSGLVSFTVPIILFGLLGYWLGIEKQKEATAIVKTGRDIKR